MGANSTTVGLTCRQLPATDGLMVGLIDPRETAVDSRTRIVELDFTATAPERGEVAVTVSLTTGRVVVDVASAVVDVVDAFDPAVVDVVGAGPPVVEALGCDPPADVGWVVPALPDVEGWRTRT